MQEDKRIKQDKTMDLVIWKLVSQFAHRILTVFFHSPRNNLDFLVLNAVWVKLVGE